MPESDLRTYPTRFGPMMAFVGDRYITRSLELYGEYCGDEWDLLAQLVKPGMTVIEVGANIGSHSVALARACAPGPIYLFEPQQRVFQVLCANLALNDVVNAVAYPEACSDEPGFVIVPPVDYSAEGNFGGVSMSAPGETVGMKTLAIQLDSLDLPACGLIKIDVEGFEPKVLRGSARTIAAHRPVLYIENDRPAQQEEVISLVSGMGYTLYWHLPPLFRPGNFNGASENVFPGIGSINMLCLPQERGLSVQGVAPVDPQNWTSPVRLRP